MVGDGVTVGLIFCRCQGEKSFCHCWFGWVLHRRRGGDNGVVAGVLCR